MAMSASSGSAVVTSNLGCTGTEERLTDCANTATATCGAQRATVTCSTSCKFKLQNNIKLYNGLTTHSHVSGG